MSRASPSSCFGRPPGGPARCPPRRRAANGRLAPAWRPRGPGGCGCEQGTCCQMNEGALNSSHSTPSPWRSSRARSGSMTSTRVTSTSSVAPASGWLVSRRTCSGVSCRTTAAAPLTSSTTDPSCSPPLSASAASSRCTSGCSCGTLKSSSRSYSPPDACTSFVSPTCIPSAARSSALNSGFPIDSLVPSSNVSGSEPRELSSSSPSEEQE
mmetsp:Transcript_5216/g.18235  ORF Transcript_5216/g.18235 Transcript_5216/m.18235 type:complete len:211 (-) Transcript_5216:328-960(-)